VTGGSQARRRISVSYCKQFTSLLLCNFLDSPLTSKSDHFSVTFEYAWGRASLERGLAERRARGRAYFSKEEAQEAVG
jgi:hypothetical protein